MCKYTLILDVVYMFGMKILINSLVALFISMALNTGVFASNISCTPTNTKVCITVDGVDDSLVVSQLINGQIKETPFNEYTCGRTRCRGQKVKLNGKSLQIVTGDENQIFYGAEANSFPDLKVTLDSLFIDDTISVPSFEFKLGRGEDGEASLLTNTGILDISSRTSRNVNPKRRYSMVKEPVSNRNRINREYHNYSFQSKSSNPNTTELRITLNHSIDLKFEISNPASITSSSSSSSSSSNVSQSSSDVGTNPNQGRFEIEVDGRQFIFESTDPVELPKIRAALQDGTIQLNKVGGFINLNTASYNPSWNFNFDSATVHLYTLGDPGYDITCDAGPDLIQRGIDDVGTLNFLFDMFWCPRSAQLIKEIL